MELPVSSRLVSPCNRCNPWGDIEHLPIALTFFICYTEVSSSSSSDDDESFDEYSLSSLCVVIDLIEISPALLIIWLLLPLLPPLPLLPLQLLLLLWELDLDEPDDEVEEGGEEETT